LFFKLRELKQSHELLSTCLLFYMQKATTLRINYIDLNKINRLYKKNN